MLRVSSVLELSGLSQPQKSTPDALSRGTAVHDAALALAHGYAPNAAPEHAGYVTAVQAWFAKFEPTVVATEVRVVNRLMGLTGRIDMLCGIDGRGVVVDYKSGGEAPSHPLQTALYHELVSHDDDLNFQLLNAGLTGLDRAILYLPGDGKFKWVLHHDPTDFYLAKSALALLRWRREHGLLSYSDPEVPDDDPGRAFVSLPTGSDGIL